MLKVNYLESITQICVVIFGKFSPKLYVAYVRHTDIIKLVGRNLRRIRLDKHLTMEELSLATELSVNQISRIELGRINTSISTLYELSLALEIDVIEFFKLDYHHPMPKSRKLHK